MSKVLVNETSLTGIADAIRGKNGTSNTYKPSEMAAAITNLPTGGGGEFEAKALHLTGDCQYRFAYGGWNWLINDYGDQMTSSGITSGTNMFSNNETITKVPFDINFASGCNFNNLFQYCKVLTSITGKINFAGPYTNGGQSMFASCWALVELPEMTGFQARKNISYPNMSGMFTDCNSLRTIPDYFADLFMLTESTYTPSSYSNLYYNTFNNCKSLDVIILPYYPGILTGNPFTSSTFQYDSRVKSIKFKYDEIPVAQWKNCTMDLTKYVGYSNSTSQVFGSNNSVIYPNRVKDDATYQALKDTNDWWTADINYSRYNHDSAVETINSLPDTSAYLASKGGTNTIKFTGAAGALTDGGAINTLTEEEIAVATAKGWTVTLS